MPFAARSTALAFSVLLAACSGPENTTPQTKLLTSTTSSTATFTGARASYTVNKTSSGYTVVDTTGKEATRNLTGVNRLVFSDFAVNLDIGTVSKSISAADLQSIVELYIAFFNRVPDADGLAYWAGQRAAGTTIAAIADTFYGVGVQYSSLTGYTANMSNTDFINIVYKNVLGRPEGADAGGQTYWNGQLANGVSRGSLVSSIITAAHSYKGDATYGWVANLLDNKVAVATAFAIDGGLNYKTDNDAISKGMAMSAAVTSANTNAALAMFSGATSAATIATTFGEIAAPTGASQASKTIALGNDEVNVLSYLGAQAIGMVPMPDLHQTYLRLTDGSVRFWVQGGGGTTIFSTTDFTTFTPQLANGKVVNILGPSGKLGTTFDADYAGAAAVFPAQNKHDLLMIYHAENHYGKDYLSTGVTPFYASLGLVRSTDNGQTWTNRQQIITGREAQPATVPTSVAIGAGDPSAIITGGYIYVFYSDIVSSTGAFKGINANCLARAPIASDGAPGNWTKYYNGSFSQPGVGGLCSQPVPAPTTISGINYQGNTSISFNTALNAYLLIFISDDGFFYSTSPDMVTWTKPKLLFQTEPQIAALNKAGGTYYYKVTLVTPANASEQITGATGYLYYAKGVNNAALGQNTHSWYRQSFTIK